MSLSTSIHRLSLGAKVNLAVLLSTGLALSIAVVVHITMEILDFQPRLEAENRKLAQVVAANVSAALVFDDPEAMQENLDAFSLIPEVYAAQIRDRNDRPKATYLSSRLDGASSGFGTAMPGTFEIATPIVVKNDPVGTLVLTIGLDALDNTIRSFIYVALLALLISLVPALATIRFMKPFILRPVNHLSRTMTQITTTQDYDARVRKLANDEFGQLAERFNAMLDEIQRRDQRLARATAEMAAAKDFAEVANATKTKFIANMSHELRTPLNAIIGYAEMVVEDLEDTGHDTQISDLNRILLAAKHLLGLINDVLDVAKIEAGKIEIHAAPTDLRVLIEEAVAAVTPTASKNGNVVRHDIDDAIGSVLLDATRFRQCLLNLLSNACKFCNGGTVSLHAYIDSTGPCETIKIDVRDTGIGIGRDKLRDLFTPFVQIDSSMTRNHGGSGLGLAITRDLLAAMGGNVTVESTLGEGSCFTIRLPMDLATTPHQASPHPQVQITGDLMPTVLVVEDSEDSALLLKRWIEPAGFEVVIAESGRAGLSLAQGLTPDFIILDVDLPDLTGWMVLDALFAGPGPVGCPVVMLTVEDDRQRALAAGASDLITKPVSKSRLVELIEAHVFSQPSTIFVCCRAGRGAGLSQILTQAGHRIELRDCESLLDVTRFDFPADARVLLDGVLLLAPDTADQLALPAMQALTGRLILWCGDDEASPAMRTGEAIHLSIATSPSDVLLAISRRPEQEQA